MMMAVDDMEIMPPNSALLKTPHPNDNPTRNPSNTMNVMMVMAAMAAVCPTLSSFLKLKSKPRQNNRKMTPMSAHEPMSDVPEIVGVREICELTRNPAMI